MESIMAKHIKKGAFLIARKIFGSDIFKDKPAFYFKLWIWLIGTARYVEGKKLGRGWLTTTYKELSNKASYRVGYRKTKPTKAQIDWFMRFLRSSGRIKTVHTTRGVKIFIKNYERYQNLASYKNTIKNTIGDLHTNTDNEHDTRTRQKIRGKKAIHTTANTITNTTVISQDRKIRSKKDNKLALLFKKPSDLPNFVWKWSLTKAYSLQKAGKISIVNQKLVEKIAREDFMPILDLLQKYYEAGNDDRGTRQKNVIEVKLRQFPAEEVKKVDAFLKEVANEEKKEN